MNRSFEIPVVISALRRNIRLIAICGGIGAALGLAYSLLATPLYTASTQILIEQRPMRALRDTMSEGRILDNAVVESQAELLRSTDVGLAVVRQLNLSREYAPSNFSKIKAWLTFGRGTLDEAAAPREIDPVLERELQAVKATNCGLVVTRVPRTNILSVEFTATDPVQAASIANAYANAYSDLELHRRSETMQHAQTWLKTRSDELRRMAGDADRVAQKFKAEHDLLSTKGVLLSEQQLNEMSTQLVTYSAATAQARARYQHIKTIIDAHEPNSAVTESLSDPVIQGLRTKILEASKRKIELQRKLGESHVSVVTFKHAISDLQDQMFQELGRVAAMYKNDYEIAAAREQALVDKLAQQQNTAVTANDAQVQLRQLEQNAENYRSLSQSYSQMYEETAQQKGFPLTIGHIMSEAHPPLSPSYPRKSLVLAICTLFGVVLGCGLTLAHESMDRVFRTGAQIRDQLGVDLIGILPNLTSDSGEDKNSRDLMYYSIDYPLSGFSETLRSVKVAAELHEAVRDPKVVGIVSLLPNEGKTLIAKNFASLLAWQGAKTLLIDADLRGRGLTRRLDNQRLKIEQIAPETRGGGSQRLYREAKTNLQILLYDHNETGPQIAEGVSPTTLRECINTNETYDFVIVDLPPLCASTSAQNISPMIDMFIFVVKWGSTPRDAVHAALQKERVIKRKMLGAILNNVAMDEIKKYETSGADEYDYGAYYGQYPQLTDQRASVEVLTTD